MSKTYLISFSTALLFALAGATAISDHSFPTASAGTIGATPGALPASSETPPTEERMKLEALPYP